MSFIILPAIDLMGGHAVCLERGNPQEVRYTADPLGTAQKFAEAGAKWLHVVDLDAAFSKGDNTATIRKILESGCSAEVGGGVRSIGRAKELLEAGAKRIVVGTKAQDIGFMEKLKQEAGKKRIVAALDALNGRIVVNGWRQETGKGLHESAGELGRYAGHFLFTPVEIEGMLKGPSIQLLNGLREATKTPVIYSGGISSLQDLTDVKKAGANGCIIGRAIYEKKFGIREALATEGE